VSENEIDSKEKLKLNILIADAYEENGEKDSSLNHYKVCLKILQSSANLVGDQDKKMGDLKKKIASLSPPAVSYSPEFKEERVDLDQVKKNKDDVGPVFSHSINEKDDSVNFLDEIPKTIIKIIDFFGCGCSPQVRK
jgi:hypothetical protein